MKINKLKNDIVGQYIFIPDIPSIIDQELYTIAQEEYNTEDIGGSDSNTTWDIISKETNFVIVEFTHKIWHFEVDNETLGNITYKGELTFNVLEGSVSSNLNLSSLDK